MSFPAKHLFVGSYLQVMWWPLNEKEGKNTLNDNNNYHNYIKILESDWSSAGLI